jgi:hypothetical protein
LIGCSSTLVILTVIASIHYTHHLTFILTIPFTLLLLSSILIGWRRRLAKKVICSWCFSSRDMTNRSNESENQPLEYHP